MALVITGPLTAAISGDVGGVNFASTRYGTVIRKRPIRINKHSAALATHRARFQNFLTQWDALSAANKLAWNNAGPRYRRTNRLGISRPMTGFLLFMMTALQKRYDSFNVVPTPPYMQAYHPPTSITLDFTVGGPFNITLPNPPDIGAIWARIYGARPVSTRTLTHIPFWRRMKYFNPDGAAHNWFTNFTEVLGAPVVDEVVYIRAHHYLWDRPMSGPITASTTIHA